MSDGFTISKIWSERFHRRQLGDDKETYVPTEDWIFYISRPTLEALRKPDKDGKTVKRVRRIVQEFLRSNPNALSQEGPFIIKTEPIAQEPNHDDSLAAMQPYFTICYPFDITDEVDKKRGVLIHLGDAEDPKEDQVILTDFGGIPSMFNEASKIAVRKALGNEQNSKHPNPPGVNTSDPMWFEFASSKILPTDLLLGPEASFNHGTFRSIISHQFIEVRLIRSRVLGDGTPNHNREQLDAISAYESLQSGFSNFAGPPGTGKSTILHMIAAQHIFQNYIRGQERETTKRIMYYVPSSMLKEEARREILAILTNVYEPAIKALNSELDTAELKSLSYIEFVSQEQLFITSGNSGQSSRYNLLSESSNTIFEQELGLQAGDRDRKRNRNLAKKGLRNIVFGLYAGELPQNYLELIPKETSINLYQPVDPTTKAGRISVTHKLTLQRFMQTKSIEDINEHLTKVLGQVKSLRQNKKLYDGGDNQFWDPAAIIHQSSKLSHDNSPLWRKLQNKIDFFIVDEVQDISITEIRILLKHFTSRTAGESLRPFRLVCAGDENQNVNHLLFMGQNEHVKFLYRDWVTHLQNLAERSAEGYKLSHQLDPASEKNLVSGYRVFDQMIQYVNDVLEKLRDVHGGLDTKSELQATPFGRNGVCVTLSEKMNENDQTITETWLGLILQQLRKQLGLNENSKLQDESVPIRVALTFDKDDYDAKFAEEGWENPFQKRLKKRTGAEKKTTSTYINPFAEQLDRLLTEYTKAFVQNSKNGEKELRNALLLKGFMDVPEIKGLTMPVTLVLPPRSLLEGEDKENEEDLSLYLVQITRAQYMNVILEDTRKFRNYRPVLNYTMDGKKEVEGLAKSEIEQWLSDILQNSAGFDHSFASLFEKTLNEYTSETLWDRLESESQTLEPSMKTYVEWLRTFFREMMNEGSKLTSKEFENLFLDLKEMDRPKLKLEGVSAESVDAREIQILSNQYLIGDHLDYLPSLKLFLTVNSLRRGIESEAIAHDDLKFDIENYLAQTGEDSDMDTDETVVRNWLKLITKQNIDPENGVCLDMEKMFAVDGGQDEVNWPQTPLPRLPMGPWRISEPGLRTDDPNTEEDLGAWMEEGSQFFSLHPEVLDKALIEGAENHETHAKIKLFLGMVSKNPIIFCDGMLKVFSLDESNSRKILDWFVMAFASKEEHSVFKNAVSAELEKRIQTDDLRERLTNYLQSSQSISQFERMVQAFDFNDWATCVRVGDLFELTVDLTHSSVEDYNNQEGLSERINQTKKKINELWTEHRELEDEAASEDEEVDISGINTRLAEIQSSLVEFRDALEKLEIRQKKVEEIELEEEDDKTPTNKKKQPKGKKKRPKEKKKRLRNHFQRDGTVFKFFNPLFESKQANDPHKQWFDLLWGFEDFLQANTKFINNGDFARSPLLFPDMRTAMGRKVNACVNTFANASEVNLTSIVHHLEASLEPILDEQGDFKEHAWIEGLLTMMGSLNLAYAGARGSFAANNTVNGAGEGNLFSRFYQELKGKCEDKKTGLPRKMLSFALNHPLGEMEESNVFGQAELKSYLASPQGRFVYFTLTNRVVTKEQALDEWKNIDLTIVKHHQGTIRDKLYLYSRDNEKNYRASKRMGLDSVDYRPYRPVTHTGAVAFRASLKQQRRLHEDYVNGATFRALAHLAEGSTEEAIDAFGDAGLLNHAAALELNLLFSNTEAKTVEDLFDTLRRILKREKTTFILVLYQSVKPDGVFSQRYYDNNKNHMYGIGPDPKPRRNDPLWKDSFRTKFQASKTNLKVRTNDPRFNFFRHATAVQHAEKIVNMLDHVLTTTNDLDLYRTVWSAQKEKANKEFIGFEKQSTTVTAYDWSWSDKASASQPEPGFAPTVPQKDTRLLDAIDEFLAPFIAADQQANAYVLTKTADSAQINIGERIAQFTGISGSTLGIIHPSAVHVLEAKKATNKRIEKERLAMFCETLKNHEHYRHNQRLQRTFRYLGMALEQDDYETALNDLSVETELKQSDKDELMKRIDSVYHLVKPEAQNLFGDR